MVRVVLSSIAAVPLVFFFTLPQTAMSEVEYGLWTSPSSSGGKFWSVSRTGTVVTTKFGKIGTEGQSSKKVFASEDEADIFVAKTIVYPSQVGHPPAKNEVMLRVDFTLLYHQNSEPERRAAQTTQNREK